MRIYDWTKDNINEPIALCLGNFDGFHLGHRFLTEQVKQYADEKNLKSAVLLFTGHTKDTLDKKKKRVLTTLGDKIRLCVENEIDIIITREFDDQLRNQDKDTFLNLLTQRFPIKAIAVGEDYHFGRFAEGTVDDLRRGQDVFGYHLIVAKEYSVDGVPVHSTAIRQSLQNGEMERAIKMLGRPYEIRGHVIKGQKRGRQLGFRTANITGYPYYMVKEGVYITDTSVDGEAYRSITSVGANITFDENEFKIETHLLDYSGDLYGKVLTVMFLHYIRDNIKFDSGEALTRQLEQDRNCALAYPR